MDLEQITELCLGWASRKGKALFNENDLEISNTEKKAKDPIKFANLDVNDKTRENVDVAAE